MLYSMMSSVNDYTSHLQDVITVLNLTSNNFISLSAENLLQ